MLSVDEACVFSEAVYEDVCGGAQWRIVRHHNVGHLSHKKSDGQPFHLMYSLKDSAVWMWRVVFYNEETNLGPDHLSFSQVCIESCCS